MNAVFWFLVIVVLGLVWLCLAFAFGKIGSVAWRLFKDAGRMLDETCARHEADAEQGVEEARKAIDAAQNQSDFVVDALIDAQKALDAFEKQEWS